MRYVKPFFFVVFLFLMLPTPTWGWNKPGHMVTGAIAYYELKANDPAALNRVIALLKRNPYYQSEWLPRLTALQDNDPDKHDLYLFMYAARWPDDVRGTDLHCEKCHYINYPYKPPGQPNSVVKLPPEAQNILTAYNSAKAKIEQGGPPTATRAIALAWVFHMVGDIHQPLHTSTLFTVIFPNGDRGGTRFYIRRDEDAPTQHLHSFWDGLIISSSSQRFSSVRKRARELRGHDDLERADLPELSESNFARWANPESLDLAIRYGYLLGQLEGSSDPEDGELLPEGYASRSRPIAERRAVLAGYRLADILSKVF